MSKLSHSFSVDVACSIGIEGAIILQHIIFLQGSSEDGWVKRSRAAMATTYPYLTDKQIRGALDRLERDGYLLSKIENKISSDRTKSFLVTKKGHELYGISHWPFGPMQYDKRANDNVPKGPMHTKVVIVSPFNSSHTTRARENDEIEIQSIEAEQAVPPSRPAQRVPPAPPVPAAPPAPGPWQPVDPENEIREMLVDHNCQERFWRQCRIPVEHYERMAGNFLLKVKSEGKPHANRADFRGHFFSWASLEFAREQKNKDNGKMRFDTPDTIIEGLDFAQRFAAELRARNAAGKGG